MVCVPPKLWDLVVSTASRCSIKRRRGMPKAAQPREGQQPESHAGPTDPKVHALPSGHTVSLIAKQTFYRRIMRYWWPGSWKLGGTCLVDRIALIHLGAGTILRLSCWLSTMHTSRTIWHKLNCSTTVGKRKSSGQKLLLSEVVAICPETNWLEREGLGRVSRKVCSNLGYVM